MSPYKLIYFLIKWSTLQEVIIFEEIGVRDIEKGRARCPIILSIAK